MQDGKKNEFPDDLSTACYATVQVVDRKTGKVVRTFCLRLKDSSETDADTQSGDTPPA